MKNKIKEAKKAYFEFLDSDTFIKNSIIKTVAEEILKNKKFILAENKKDIKKGKEKKLSNAMLDRLLLNDERVLSISNSCLDVAKLDDPVGTISEMKVMPEGFKVGKIDTPIGLILIIYESRPNVTVEAATLSLKSGNGVVLRGGSDAYHSNKAFISIIQKVLKKHNINENLVCFVDDTDRKIVDKLLVMNDLIDLVIPRGGEALITSVTKKATIPVLKHYKGVCHIYVHKLADLSMAEKIVVNAKVQRPGVCNSLETLLVDKEIADKFLGKCLKTLEKEKVKIVGCKETVKIYKDAKKANEQDWYTEYLDLILSVKVVKNSDEAIMHINKYGSMHTESIITKDIDAAQKFIKKVDSSSVMVNASTRLADGGVYGLGAEIGIATDKLHARGPMGLKELTTKKWIVLGDGHIRE